MDHQSQRESFTQALIAGVPMSIGQAFHHKLSITSFPLQASRYRRYR
jgi:hypothetical protein